MGITNKSDYDVLNVVYKRFFIPLVFTQLVNNWHYIVTVFLVSTNVLY